MKAIFALLIILVLGFIAHLFLPWWIIVLVCFLVGFTFIDKTKHGVFVGFISVFFLWGAVAFYKSYSNDYIMLERIAILLPGQSKWLVLLATSLIGGIIGMLGTLCGYFLQTINEKPKRKRTSYYS